MNERIRQLWDQAEKEIQAEYEDESRRNRRLYNEIFLPKFAELIVQECSKIVLNCGIIGSNNERDFIVASREIKQHFGIKE